MAPLSALAAARHMCARSDWQLSNLKLQKMLYLAQMLHLGQTGERLFNGGFEAWDYGPVVPEVYREVKSFGSGPIKFVMFPTLRAPSRPADEERVKVLDEAYDQLANMTAGQLVNVTHWQDGAWAKNYIPGHRNRPIPDPDIIDEYRKRVAAAEARRAGRAI